MLHPALLAPAPCGYLSLQSGGGGGGGGGGRREDTARHRGNIQECDPGFFPRPNPYNMISIFVHPCFFFSLKGADF